MDAIKKGIRSTFSWILCLCLSGFIIGCASSSKEEKNEKDLTSSSATPSSQSSPSLKNADRAEGRYYDFEDVKIPNELKLDDKKSNVFKSADIKSGVLHFDGYVETKSLINFFMAGMARDNWKLKADFKRPQTILLFEKKNKRSIFFIEDTAFNTHVEIWMIPTKD
jgi:hypothetical protein